MDYPCGKFGVVVSAASVLRADRHTDAQTDSIRRE